MQEEGNCGICKRPVCSDEPNHREMFDDGQFPVHDKCCELLGGCCYN